MIIKPEINLHLTKPAELDNAHRLQIDALNSNLRWPGNFEVNRDLSRQSVAALKAVGRVRINAQRAIAEASVKSSQAILQTNIVSTALGSIGVSLTRLDASATAVDQTLTNNAAAATATHLINRAANKKIAEDMVQSGKISEDEATAITGFSDSDAVEDIHRSRMRVAKSKEIVTDLHETALRGIAAVKTTLSNL